jgi:hypothetical protein
VRDRLAANHILCLISSKFHWTKNVGERARFTNRLSIQLV